MASISNAPVRHRTVGIDLAISAVQLAQIFDDGRAIGKPIRFRLTSTDLRRFVSAIKSGVGADTPIAAVMEPTGMAWFPVTSASMPRLTRPMHMYWAQYPAFMRRPRC